MAVRRLLIHVSQTLKSVGEQFLFEPNTANTRRAIQRAFNPILQRIQDSQGLGSFIVVSDDSNNPPADVAAGILRVRVAIQPVAAAEFIPIDIVVSPDGVSLATS